MKKKLLDLNYIGLNNLIFKYEIDSCNFENTKFNLSVYYSIFLIFRRYKMKYDIIFIGGGQASIFGAYEAINKNPNLKILVVDKGQMLDKRVCPKEKLGRCVKCPTCAIIYGVSGAGAYSDSKFNMDYRVGGDVHTITSKSLVNETIQYVANIYKDFGFDDEPTGLLYNEEMELIKRRCIENDIQLVDTPTMHLGTDGSRELYSKLIEKLLEKGIEFSSLFKKVKRKKLFTVTI